MRNLDTMGSDWLRWVQIGSDGFKMVQVGSDWFRWVQFGSDGFRLVQMRSDWFRWAQIGSDGFVSCDMTHARPSSIATTN